MDHQRKSLKAQFKAADKMQSRFVVVVGPEELEQGNVTVRNMLTHEEQLVPIEAVATWIQQAAQ